MTENIPDNINLANLLAASVTVVEMVDNLNQIMQISEQLPSYMFEAVVLAAAVLLRLVKGMPPGGLDQCSGRAAIFSAINIFKSMSIVNNDVPARVAGIFTKLWSSNEVFRNSQGDYDTVLHVRNRLIISVSFDCFWWYKNVVIGWPSSQGKLTPLIDNGYILTKLSSKELDTHKADVNNVDNSLDDDFFNFWGFYWATGVASPSDFQNSQYIDFSEQTGNTQ